MTTNPVVFIIEDDALVIPIYSTALQDAQYEPIIFQNGEEAMARLKGTTPALVILDMRLPGLPGTSILQAIRSDKRFENTRIIVVSADATLTEYVREKADLVLVKPVGYQQLREMAARLRPKEDT
jgi:DNA-binding response OmpR family regulator